MEPLRILPAEDEWELVKIKLWQYGYFDLSTDVRVVKYSVKQDATSKLAVNKYQKWFGLQIDGNPGPVTASHILASRCGCPDHTHKEDANLCAWDVSNLGYNFDIKNLKGISNTKELVSKAFKVWSDVCGLSFFIPEIAMPNIIAKPGSMSSGTLAWSYLGCGFSESDTVTQEYNQAVTWSEKLLLDTLIHEIGHAIGLSHDNNSNSIMYPSSNGQRGKLYSGDIEQVVERYGPNLDSPVDPNEDMPEVGLGIVSLGGIAYRISMEKI